MLDLEARVLAATTAAYPVANPCPGGRRPIRRSGGVRSSTAVREATGGSRLRRSRSGSPGRCTDSSRRPPTGAPCGRPCCGPTPERSTSWRRTGHCPRRSARLGNPLTPGHGRPDARPGWPSTSRRPMPQRVGRCSPRTGCGPGSPASSPPSPVTPRPPCCTTSTATAGTPSWPPPSAWTPGCWRRCCGAAGEPAGELLTPAAAGARPATRHPRRCRARRTPRPRRSAPGWSRSAARS